MKTRRIELDINEDLLPSEIRALAGVEVEVTGCPECGETIAEDLTNGYYECTRCGYTAEVDEFYRIYNE